MQKSPRMTLDDVLADMRAHGMSMGKPALITCLREGIFPFAHIIGEPSGKTNFLIMRRDYDAWAEEYLKIYCKDLMEDPNQPPGQPGRR